MEYNVSGAAEPVKKNVYQVPGNGYLQVGDDEMCWHLNDDNEEIWTETKVGETRKFYSVTVNPTMRTVDAYNSRDSEDDSDDEESKFQVIFVPDDTCLWTDMQQTVNRIMDQSKKKK